MANKNNQTTIPETRAETTPENQAETTPENQATAPATPETKVNEADELVPVFIPKQNRSDTERFVAVNGERILIQTGKTVQVPKRFAEVIKNSESMAAEAAAYIDANISN